MQTGAEEIINPLSLLSPGHVEALYVEESGIKRGAVGFIGFDIIGQYTCYVYWYVENDRQLFMRYPNKLGLGCTAMESKFLIKDCLNQLVTGDKAECKARGFKNIKFKNYKLNVHHLQYCTDHFCIDGQMSLGHHFNVTLLIFPRYHPHDWHMYAPERLQYTMHQQMRLTKKEEAQNDDGYPVIQYYRLCIMLIITIAGIILIPLFLSRANGILATVMDSWQELRR